jgi:uncharacterized DUF497 family protein
LWYYSAVEYEWDPAKAKINLRKHQVTFPYATRVFIDPNRIDHPDAGDHDGEERWLAIGRVDEFILVVVYTCRLDRIRMISARKATRNELIEYWNGQIQA